MNFVCIVFELGDKMLTLSSMENLIVQCNLNINSYTMFEENRSKNDQDRERKRIFDVNQGP